MIEADLVASVAEMRNRCEVAGVAPDCRMELDMAHRLAVEIEASDKPNAMMYSQLRLVSAEIRRVMKKDAGADEFFEMFRKVVQGE